VAEPETHQGEITMMEPVQPKYDWGQRVRAVIDLFNDGSYPDAAEGELLVPAGGVGEIVNVGHHAEANLSVYLVEFGPHRVLGCLEDEIELDIPGAPRALTQDAAEAETAEAAATSVSDSGTGGAA
jgi:nitrogen fixation protein NifZ